MRIGIFGGSFDPIHVGHVALAHAAATACNLSQVLLIPTAASPYKLSAHMTDGIKRLHMCELVAAEDPLLKVCDLEVARGSVSYTIDTVESLVKSHPTDDPVLLMGGDMFTSVQHWYRFADIAALVELCILPREENTAAITAHAQMLQETMNVRCRVVNVTLPTVSSTQVRQLVSQGKDVTGLVPACVAQYIAKQELYANEATFATEREWIEQLRKRLTPERFAHSLAVAEEAQRLAIRWGCDADKARTAGLLHDVAKDDSTAKQLQTAAQFGILLDNDDIDSEKRYHAMVGAAELQHEWGITDADILNAVRYHTTGRGGMSLLEKIVFSADFTSADRQYPTVNVMRQLVNESLEDARRYALGYMIKERQELGRRVHPNTMEAYQEVGI